MLKIFYYSIELIPSSSFFNVQKFAKHRMSGSVGECSSADSIMSIQYWVIHRITIPWLYKDQDQLLFCTKFVTRSSCMQLQIKLLSAGGTFNCELIR